MAQFRRLAAAAIFASSVVNLSAAEPSTAPAFDAGAVVRGLISNDWRERQRVEDSLVDQGEAIKPLIQDLLKTNDDAEVRGRLDAALKRVEENRLTGPSIVTLHLKDAEPRQAFAELARQSYAELKPFPETLWDEGSWVKVSVDVERVPFWTAFRKLADATGLDLRPYNDGLRLMRGARTGGPSLVRGAFLIVASQITYNKTIFLGPAQGAGRADFSLHLAAYAEPKLQILRIDPTVKLEQAVDDHGNSLIPDAPDNRGHWGGGQGGVWSFFARLKYPAKNPGGRIARLKGSLVFTLQTRTQKIEVPHLLSASEKPMVVGDVPIILRDCKKNNDYYELRISVTPDAGNAWIRLQQTMQNRLRVLDSEGRPLERRGGGSHAAGNEIELTAAFARGQRPDGGLTGEPATLLWEVATETRDIHVPIEFTDLDMRIFDN